MQARRPPLPSPNGRAGAVVQERTASILGPQGVYGISTPVGNYGVERPPSRTGATPSSRWSWNRSEPTGYKIVRVPFKEGGPEGYYENFMVGFWRAEVSVAPPRLPWWRSMVPCWSPTIPVVLFWRVCCQDLRMIWSTREASGIAPPPVTKLPLDWRSPWLCSWRPEVAPNESVRQAFAVHGDHVLGLPVRGALAYFTSERHATRPRSCQTWSHPFPDQVALELGEASHNGPHQLAAGRAEVETQTGMSEERSPSSCEGHRASARGPGCFVPSAIARSRE